MQASVMPGTSTELLKAIIRNREREAIRTEERKEKYRATVRKAKAFFGCDHGSDDRLDCSEGCYFSFSSEDVLQNFS